MFLSLSTLNPSEMIMHHLTKTLLLMTAMLAPMSASAQTVLRFGTEGAYAPFAYFDKDGTLKGFDIDIGNAICAQLKRKCEWVSQDWDGLIPALKAKKFDAILASMSITEKRKEAVDFTDRYYFSPGMIIARAENGINLTAEGLKGKTIGVQAETNYSLLLDTKYKNQVEIKQYKTQDNANLDFMNGRLDAIIANSTILDAWVKSNGGYQKFRRVGDLIRDPILGGGAGIAVRKGDSNLLNDLNRAIAAIKLNGTYNAINKKYFDFDIQ